MQFLALNILNSAVLTLFLLLFPYVPFVNASWLGVVGSVTMLIIGFWYIFQGVAKELKAFIKGFYYKKDLSFKIKYFSLKEFFLLTFFFIVENVMSTIIFYASLNYPVLFICATFIFHYMAFSIGYDMGDKLLKVIPFDASVISGVVFYALGVFNLFE